MCCHADSCIPQTVLCNDIVSGKVLATYLCGTVNTVPSVPVWLSGRALRLQRKKVVGSIPREHTY